MYQHERYFLLRTTVDVTVKLDSVCRNCFLVKNKEIIYSKKVV